MKPFNLDIAQKLFKFSLMAIISVVSSLGSILFIRNYIGSHVSWEDAGYWQALISISDAYLMVVTIPLSVYYLPRLSEIQDKIELKKEIFNGFKIVLPIVISMAIFIFIIKVYIIKILFTKDFYPMLDLFGWQLIGDVIKITSWLFSMVLVAKAMTSDFIYAEISTSLLFIISSVYLIKKFGLIGVTYAFTIQYAYYLVLMLFINIKRGTIV